MDLYTPLVSVCIPTYRGESHIAATIDSVLKQSLQDFELIIVDDNSPDGTVEVVESYSDERIRLFKNSSNLGAEGNWNCCLTNATGKYFKLLPQDDVIYDNTLQLQVDVMESDTDENIALVYGPRNIVGSEGQQLAKRGYPRNKGGRVPANKLIRACILRGSNPIGEPGAVLMRRELTNVIGPFDGSISYVIDLDYWVRLLRHGDAYCLEEPVSSFRVSSGSWSVAIGKGQSADYRAFINKLKKDHADLLRAGDISRGVIMAELNKILRLAFYQFALKREK